MDSKNLLMRPTFELNSEYRFNWTKALRIIGATLALSFGVQWAAQSAPGTFSLRALLCLVGFSMVVFGSPYERRLTRETMDKIDKLFETAAVEDDTEKTDASE